MVPTPVGIAFLVAEDEVQQLQQILPPGSLMGPSEWPPVVFVLSPGLNPTIAELSAAIDREVDKSAEARRLMTHPGVGPLTSLAFVLIIGSAERFQCGKQIAAYLGLVPLEDSSGERRRLGHITKQGNSLLRFLLVESAQVAARSIPQWRNQYFHLAMRRGRKIAKVAMARKLAIRLFWMMRQGWDYEQMKKFGSQGRKSGSHAGVPTASTWYPRLRSSRIIRLVRLRLDFAFTAGPRSS